MKKERQKNEVYWENREKKLKEVKQKASQSRTRFMATMPLMSPTCAKEEKEWRMKESREVEMKLGDIQRRFEQAFTKSQQNYYLNSKAAEIATLTQIKRTEEDEDELLGQRDREFAKKIKKNKDIQKIQEMEKERERGEKRQKNERAIKTVQQNLKERAKSKNKQIKEWNKKQKDKAKILLSNKQQINEQLKLRHEKEQLRLNNLKENQERERRKQDFKKTKVLGKELKLNEMKREREEEMEKRRLVQCEIHGFKEEDKDIMMNTIQAVSKMENFKNKATEKMIKERLDEALDVKDLFSKPKKNEDELI